MNEGTTAVERFDASNMNTIRTAVLGWLAGYKGGTREGYAREMKLFMVWLHNAGEGSVNLFTCRRTHLELYARWCEETGFTGKGCKKSTVAHKMAVLASFYRWATYEELLDHNPAGNLRRPKLEYITTRESLDRMESIAFLGQASIGSPRDNALCSLLLLNGLRISEALNADIEDLGEDRGHHTMRIVGKGDKPAVIPLAPRTRKALYAYIDERTSGPIFMGVEGKRMGRHAASRIVKRIAKRAGVKKNISPHSTRHAFITNALDAGVSLRDVQHSARHSSPATTSVYDHGRQNLDRHATYTVSGYIAGSSGRE